MSFVGGGGVVIDLWARRMNITKENKASLVHKS